MAVCWAGLPRTPGQGSRMGWSGLARPSVQGEGGAGVGGVDVQAQISRRNIRQREGTGLGDSRHRTGAGVGARRGKGLVDHAADGGPHPGQGEARRGAVGQQGKHEQRGDRTGELELCPRRHGTFQPLPARLTVTKAVGTFVSLTCAITRTLVVLPLTRCCWSAWTRSGEIRSRLAYQATAALCGSLAGRARATDAREVSREAPAVLAALVALPPAAGLATAAGTAEFSGRGGVAGPSAWA